MDALSSIRHELRMAHSLVNSMAECNCFRDDCLIALTQYFNYVREEVQDAINSAVGEHKIE